MALNGFVKLHRRFLEWGWYDDPVVPRVFLDLLLNATHHETSWHGEDLKPGQLVTSRKSLAGRLNLSEQQVKTALKKLEKTGEISKKVTNRYSLITIEKWTDYQLGDEDSNQQITNKQPTSNQQATTSGEGKEYKNNIYSPATAEIVAYLNEKTGQHYKAKTAKTVSLIQARLKENFTVDDFKVVIDKKVKEWRGTEMEKYLRPETLFGTKFEGYLNQTGTENKPKPKSNVPRPIEPPKYPEFKPEPKRDTVQMPDEIRARLRDMF